MSTHLRFTLAVLLGLLAVSYSVWRASQRPQPAPQPAPPPSLDASDESSAPDSDSADAPASSPNQPEFDYVRAQAEQLELDPERIVDFVREQIARQPYRGSLRGPTGTLWSGAGNDVDRAELLAALLSRAGQQVRFASQHDRLWVQIADDSGWQDVHLSPTGPQASGGETEFHDQLPDEMRHRLEVTVEVRSGEGPTAAPSAWWPTAELAGRPLVLTFAEGHCRLCRQDGAGPALVASCESESESLTLMFAHQPPGAARAAVYRREIYSASDKERPWLSDSRNTHVVTALPGELPRWAFDKEVELCRGWAAHADVAKGYLLALSHLVESDRVLSELRGRIGAPAWFAEPRVIIGSTYYEAGSEEPAARALDLRRNIVHVEGDESARARLGVARSIFEGSLEAQVLRRAMEVPVLSALEIFRQHMEPYLASTPDRIESYQNVLERFAKETRPGARLNIELDPDRRLEFVNLDEGGVRCELISERLRADMDGSELSWPTLQAAAIGSAKLAGAALELETLLGPVAGSDVNYQPQIETIDSLDQLLGPGVRIVNRSLLAVTANPATKFDYELLETTPEGGLLYKSVDEWDDRNQPQPRQVHRLRIPAETMESASMISTWCSQQRYDRGAQHLMFSRQMHRELKTQGHTEVRFLKHDMTESKPIKLYLCDRGSIKVNVNGQKRQMFALWVAGSYSEDDSGKWPFMLYRPLLDRTFSRTAVMNRWVVLDDPRFPLVISPGMQIHTATTGRVMSQATGRGIGDAEVRVDGSQEQVSTWADGQFRLPVIRREDHQLQNVKVQVSCQGYQTWEQEVDLTTQETPLRIELAPVPRPQSMLWIGQQNAAEQLPKISDPRVRRFVSQAIEDDPHLSALVPRSRVNYGLSSAHAWLLLDNRTFHITPVTEDGLHGVAGQLGLQLVAGQVDSRRIGLSAHFGMVASWYSYAGGRLDALARMMDGETFDDLGHDHAVQFALDFLRGMKPDGFLASAAAAGAGVNLNAFEAGFLGGLLVFEQLQGQ